MITVTFYFKENSLACEQIRKDLLDLQAVIPHRLLEINIQSDPELERALGDQVPLVQAGVFRLKSDFTRQDLEIALKAASDRHLSMADDNEYQKRIQKRHTLSTADQISHWFSKHYMVLFNLIVGLYVGLPFLAPVMMEIRMPSPANLLYTVYSPLCHQLAFRSFFIFGEQPYYPRALAGIPGVITYEEISGDNTDNVIFARSFIGDEIIGYKIAICERCLAIYCTMLLFGVIFSLTGKKLRPIPWYIWAIFGLIPMGLDGVSQLPSLAEGFLPIWFPIRESTPILRVITGGLFGITTAWYLYPFIEDSMKETRVIIAKKTAIARILTK